VVLGGLPKPHKRLDTIDAVSAHAAARAPAENRAPPGAHTAIAEGPTMCCIKDALLAGTTGEA